MTSGSTLRNATRPLWCWRCCRLAPAICFAALDVDGLLKSLARPAPATTPFVEVRYSKLLDQPLVVKGQLEYHEDGALVRAVSEPFRERTEIRGETVTVERVGKSHAALLAQARAGVAQHAGRLCGACSAGAGHRSSRISTSR